MKKFAPGRITKTRSLGMAKPYITNATQLLFSTVAGQKIFEEATLFCENLYIGKSLISEKAGKGLHVVAKQAPLDVKKGRVITWFNGEVKFTDKKRVSSGFTDQCSIGLGSSVRTASQLIVCDPDNYDLLGCGYFANHSTKPNCKIDYLYSPNLDVIAVVLIALDDFYLAEGYALEMTINYHSSAINTHKIDGVCDYSATPIEFNTMLALEEFKFVQDTSSSLAESDATIVTSDSEITDCSDIIGGVGSPEDGSPLFIEEKDMPKKPSKEYAAIKMEQLIAKFLQPASFTVHTAATGLDFINLLAKTEEYFFIRVNPALDEFYWIFMYHDKSGKKLYLFDPEGLPRDKFSPEWLNSARLQATEICICDSWFVFSRYRSELQYQQTGAICVALAKAISSGLKIKQIKLDGLQDHERWNSVSKRITDFNLVLPATTPYRALSTLLVHYPSRIASQAVTDRDGALSSILKDHAIEEKQEGKQLAPTTTFSFFTTSNTSSTPPQPEPLNSTHPRAEAAVNAPGHNGGDLKRRKMKVDEKKDEITISSIELALKRYQTALAFTDEDIFSIVNYAHQFQINYLTLSIDRIDKCTTQSEIPLQLEQLQHNIREILISIRPLDVEKILKGESLSDAVENSLQRAAIPAATAIPPPLLVELTAEDVATYFAK